MENLTYLTEYIACEIRAIFSLRRVPRNPVVPGDESDVRIQNPRRDGEIPVAQLVSVFFVLRETGTRSVSARIPSVRRKVTSTAPSAWRHRFSRSGR